MTETQSDKPRWHGRTRRADGEGRWGYDVRAGVTHEKFIGQAGGLDLYARENDHMKTRLTIICSIERAEHFERRHNYSHGGWEWSKEAFLFDDEDVVPELYELCLIHQLYEAYINDRET